MKANFTLLNPTLFTIYSSKSRYRDTAKMIGEGIIPRDNLLVASIAAVNAIIQSNITSFKLIYTLELKILIHFMNRY